MLLTVQPQLPSVDLGIYLHGINHSKELVAGKLIYLFIEWEFASVLLLKDTWAVHNLQLCSDCPNEILRTSMVSS